jgi:hypothetical protein
MRLFYRIKRDGKGLWVKMYSDCKYPYYAASRLINNRKEAADAFNTFAADIRRRANELR